MKGPPSGGWIGGENKTGAVFSNGRVWAPKFVYEKPTKKHVQLGGKSVVVWQGKGFNGKLRQLVLAHWHLKDDAISKASDRTKEERLLVLTKLFTDLRSNSPYQLERPENIDARHIRWWFRRWEEPRMRADGSTKKLSAATVSNELSILRQFCRWIHQPQLIDASGISFSEGPISRPQAAQRDKSWSGAGLDFEAAANRVFEMEPWVAIALHLQFAFGARREEAICFKPKRAWPGGRLVHFFDNTTKGGRPRVVPILADWEVTVLQAATEFVRRQGGAHDHIGGADRDLHQNLRRYSYVLERLGMTGQASGVTGHGLRAEFAMRLASRRGLPVPIRGGNMADVPQDERSLSRRVVSEALGHSRERITAAYYGDPRKPAEQAMPYVESDAELSDMASRLLERVKRTRRVESSLGGPSPSAREAG